MKFTLFKSKFKLTPTFNTFHFVAVTAIAAYMTSSAQAVGEAT